MTRDFADAVADELFDTGAECGPAALSAATSLLMKHERHSQTRYLTRMKDAQVLKSPKHMEETIEANITGSQTDR